MPSTLRNPRQLLVDIAARELAAYPHETSRNQGPGIEKYWLATTYPEGYRNREPWCAALMCWLFLAALVQIHHDRIEGAISLSEGMRPKSAACREWIAWAQRRDVGAKIFKSHDGLYFPAPGDVVLFAFGQAAPNHIGLVEAFDGTTVRTIEGNTNDDGVREGYEMARRKRRLNECAAFIRVGAVGEKFA